MRHLLLKAGLAGVCALALLVPYGAVQAEDQENLSVEENLRPNLPPSAFEAGASDKTKNQPGEAAEGEGESSGNIENEMIDKIGPGAP